MRILGGGGGVEGFMRIRGGGGGGREGGAEGSAYFSL